MVYLGKQIKTSNMLLQRAEGVEEKRRRLGRLRRERSTLAAVSRGDRHHSYCEVWGVGGWGIGRLPLPLVCILIFFSKLYNGPLTTQIIL